jgi:hypothetical protein
MVTISWPPRTGSSGGGWVNGYTTKADHTRSSHAVDELVYLEPLIRSHPVVGTLVSIDLFTLTFHFVLRRPRVRVFQSARGARLVAGRAWIVRAVVFALRQEGEPS